MTIRTWRVMILAEMQKHGESTVDVEVCTLTDAELNTPFNSSFGIIEGKPFTMWTRRRVYFPGVYDGCEVVKSVSRHPDGIATPHVGGALTDRTKE